MENWENGVYMVNGVYMEDMEDVEYMENGNNAEGVGGKDTEEEPEIDLLYMSLGRDTGEDMLRTVLNEMRSSAMLCDAVVIVEEEKFSVHRNVLAAISPYYRALFTRWSSLDQMEYTFNGVSSKVMDLVIQYMYTRDIHVTINEAKALLVTADYLFIQDLAYDCQEFLKTHVNCKNCLEIWKFADIHSYNELRDEAYMYVLHHFEACVQSLPNRFFELTVDELCDILEKDELNTTHEKTAFKAIIKWIKHEPNIRTQHITTLLLKVRLALLSPSYLTENLKANLPVSSVLECQPIITSALKVMYDATLAGPQTRLSNPLTRPRLPYSILFAIGGFAEASPTNIIESYDSRLDNWIFTSSREPRARAYHGTVVLDDCVYVIGGFDTMEYYNTMCRFNPLTGMWMELSPMHSRRCYISVAVLNGYIYAMGGFDGIERLNTAECYDPSTNQWSLIPPMHDQRSDASAAVLDSKVYICGGFNGSECLCTTEYFNPLYEHWTLIEPMHVRRSGVGVATLNNQVFAIGGFDGGSRLQSVEAYDPNVDSWRLLTPMFNPRSNFGVEVMDGFLYVIGGYGGEGTTSSCERYDERRDEWVDIQNMNVSRSAVSCCVISGLDNVRDYTIPREELD